MSNTTLTEREKQARNAYLRKWRKENPDKVREYQKRWYAKIADQMEQEEQDAQDTQDDRKDDAYDG